MLLLLAALTSVPATTPAASASASAVTGYASLAEAIAAQGVDVADEAVTCLAGAVYFEAGGEPAEGQLAVAQVIMNRVASGRFRSDVCGVVKQPGQFGFVRHGVVPVIDAARARYRTARAVARVALAGLWTATVPQALYFHARSEGASARWTRVAQIGNHIFYR